MSEEVKAKRETKLFSKPLFKQSLKANFPLWLTLTIAGAMIFIIINLAIGSKRIFTNINISTVNEYVMAEEMSWLQILGLLSRFGFSLDRIQAMSQMDLNAVLNELVYKIAGVLLPMIYTMIVANKLVASQVNDGSMAYVLSTPTNRKKVVFTQYIFLIGSLFAMYVVISFSAIVTGAIGNALSKSSSFATFFLRTLLYCVGSGISMFALAGICFGASTWFNKSNRSIAVGGGACVISFLCCILGLFGSDAFVNVGIGVRAMYFFNYVSIFTLLDTSSISMFSKYVTGAADGAMTLTWLIDFGILIVIGIVGALIGSIKFTKKDLPL